MNRLAAEHILTNALAGPGLGDWYWRGWNSPTVACVYFFSITLMECFENDPVHCDF